MSFGVGGVKEYLHDNSSLPQNGVIVNEATGQALADGVLWLLANQTRREDIAKTAQTQVSCFVLSIGFLCLCFLFFFEF